MPSGSRRVAFVVSIISLCSIPTIDAAQPATLTVQVDRQGIAISPTLYGTFFEEINRAGEGGLYGQMLQNGSFEDDRDIVGNARANISGWKLVKNHGEATMTIDDAHPLNLQNRHSLRLDVANIESSLFSYAGVANEGFHGISIRKGSKYTFSVYARCEDNPAPTLRVRLDGANIGELAGCSLRGVGPKWKRFDFVLTASDESVAARLVISTDRPGTVWLDRVSLVPKVTWKGHGLRPDLAEMLAAMKPAFVRFPGGCYVEGDELANAFRWKKSIGDVVLRPGHWNLWGYRSSDGLGYHEYLQMCEDLHAEPLFVINCGMAHKDSAPMAKMNDWVQDALDAIEYANGSADSHWGALRTKNGHPAPFNMKYMEIGNENGGETYQEHYRLFYDAIKARYPKMQLVANCPTTKRPTEILDEHYYSNPEFFINNAARYDAYPRGGRKIYVGEYAVTENCGQGNLRAALGEAAFMTGLERNSDVVVMASYAPLFVNKGWRQWNPDAIVFDASRVCGTPSYYVQKMFSANRADVLLPLDLAAPEIELPTKGGAIGVGTWATKAEFKDIKVTRADHVLFQSDFRNGTKGWKLLDGQWRTDDGALHQESTGTFIRAIAGDKSWTDYTYTLKARKLGGNEGFLILFNVQDANAKSWWNLGGWGNTRHAIETAQGELGTSVDGRIETGRWYDIRIEVCGPRIRCYLDGKLIHDTQPKPMRTLYAVAGLDQQTGDVVLKAVNVSPVAVPAAIELRGAVHKSRSATVTVLAAADPSVENSLEEPNRVVPVTTEINGQDDDFLQGRHVFPANSVTIMRLHLGN